MAYRKPFTPHQRREAKRLYRSCRKHLALLRRRYPPRDIAQRQLLELYADAAGRIRRELEKPDRSIDASVLNHAEATCQWLMAEYWSVRH